MILDIYLSKGEILLVMVIFVIFGLFFCILLGYLMNRYGVWLMFMISFILFLFFVFWISIVDFLFDLIVGGFFLGIGGVVFFIGVIFFLKYYLKEKYGVVNGIYGVGNIGIVIIIFVVLVIV